ncbi:MAG: 4-phosphoerythronate dehydrogenase [Fibrobacteria bacterium]|nr:4-phosphoerythronate dehydrogenase [Fibrobacteria bacterium]
MKILVDENIPSGVELFAPYGDVEAFPGRALSHEKVKEADALIIRSITKINRDLLHDTPVRFVGTATIGTDHVDQDYLKDANITFASAPGCNSNSVGEFVVSALLELRRKKIFDYKGKTLGIIGFGNVGKNVDKKAQILGMNVLRNDPPLEEESPGKYSLVSLETICRESDIITIHVPLTKDGKYPTFQMINAVMLKECKNGVVFFNSCRGNVICEDDLLDARQSGKISAMLLDVFPGEPAIDRKLVDSCTIATPHIAGYSVEGKGNGSLQVLKAFCSCFQLDLRIDVDKPFPEEPLIQLPADPDEALYSAVTHGYPILKDDKNLRDSLDADDPGIQFDTLRKSYWKRFEFPNYQIENPEKVPENTREQLRALGFRLS